MFPAKVLWEGFPWLLTLHISLSMFIMVLRVSVPFRIEDPMELLKGCEE